MKERAELHSQKRFPRARQQVKRLGREAQRLFWETFDSPQFGRGVELLRTSLGNGVFAQDKKVWDHAIGFFFELAAWRLLVRLEKDNLVLSPDQAVKFYEALFPERQLILNHGFHSGMDGTIMPDAIILARRGSTTCIEGIGEFSLGGGLRPRKIRQGYGFNNRVLNDLEQGVAMRADEASYVISRINPQLPPVLSVDAGRFRVVQICPWGVPEVPHLRNGKSYSTPFTAGEFREVVKGITADLRQEVANRAGAW